VERHDGSDHDQRNQFAQRLFTPLPARYDVLAEVLSLGQNRRWRQEMVAHAVPGTPSLVLDVACGTAGASRLIADRSSATVVGVDLTEAMLRRGARTVEAAGLAHRIDLVVGQAERLPFADGAFDALTFTYLLRYVDDPEATLRELARVVKPGGRVACLDFFVPVRTAWRASWWLYTRSVLPLAGWVMGGRPWWDVGTFLGPNITRHYRRYPLDWMVAAWQRSGLDEVGVKVMSLGGGLVMWGRREGP
jgi:demethylmenaquinone methyltransferase / 2-methoxy-6-polyprenyl-1,4-benzoquinol methylase